MKISNTYRKMAEVYKIFCCYKNADLSKKALEEAYLFESKGIGEHYSVFGNRVNGYLLGKKWLNVFVSEWKKDIRGGLLSKEELYVDNKFPHWWLDKVLK